MALDIFKARLKAKSTAAGANLSQVRIDAIADRLNKRFPDITDEAEHDAILDDLQPADSYKELARLDDFDRAKAAKDKKDKENQQGGSESEKPADEKPLTGEDKTQALLQELLNKVNKLETEKSQATIQQQVATALQGIEPSFYEDWAMPGKAEEIDAFVDKVKGKWEKFKPSQSAEDVEPAQQRTSHQPKRGTGGNTQEASKAEVDSVLNNIM